MPRDDVMMVLRLAMQGVAGAMIARGMGDAALWEALIGGVLALVGLVLSWRARRALAAQALSGQAALGMAREMVGRR